MKHILQSLKKIIISLVLAIISHFSFGQLPADALKLINECKANKSTTLELNSFALSKIPDEISEMTWLDTLELNDNSIHSIQGIEKLTKLKYLSISSNLISKIEGLNLNKLYSLNLSYNKIEKIEGLEKLPNLSELNLSSNKLTKIEGLEYSKNIKKLIAYGNSITNYDDVVKLSHLQELDLSSNQIAQIIDLTNLEKLQLFNLTQNKLNNYLEIKPFITKNWEIYFNDIQLNINHGLILKDNYFLNLDLLNDTQKISSYIIEIENKTSTTPIYTWSKIWRERKLKSGYLNLSSEKLTEIPKEINQMDWLVNLNLVENSLVKIEGLGNLSNLNNLYLGNNQITKIEGLENLSKLNNLSLSNNRISKIEGLENLSNLKDLSINNNRISKIERLENLSNLKDLSLNKNQITKIEGLNNLSNLKDLSLNNNQITQIEGLGNLVNLKKIDLEHNNISESGHLNILQNLKQINLEYNKITDLSSFSKLLMNDQFYFYNNPIVIPNQEIVKSGRHSIIKYFIERGVHISNPPNIKEIIESKYKENSYPNSKKNSLSLANLKLTEIPQEIADMTNLEELDLSDNFIKKIENLSKLKNLKRLILTNNQIVKIEGLSDLTELTELDLSNNKISESDFHQGLVNLKTINLSNNNIQDLSPFIRLLYTDCNYSNNPIKFPNQKILDGGKYSIIKYFIENDLIKTDTLRVNKIIENCKNKSLTTLNLYGENLTEIPKEISNLTGLEQLYLVDNKISKIENLENLYFLTELDLTRNNISKIQNLNKNFKLKKLNLEGNQITKIDGLETLNYIKKINLSSNKISKIENLSNLEILVELNLANNQIKESENLEKLASLTKLNIGDNKITDLTPFIHFIYEDCYYYNNPISTPNQSIVNEGKFAVIKYFLDNDLVTPNYYRINKKINDCINNRSEELNLYGQNLKEIPEAIRDLTWLKKLYLVDNKISKIEKLEKLTELTYLDLTRNNISKIEGLEQNVNLYSLKLEGNQITQIEGIDNLNHLGYLDLTLNKIAKLECNNSLSRIAQIRLISNQIEDITPLYPDCLKKEISLDWANNRWDTIYLGDNPIKIPDINSVKKGKEAILEYFKFKK